LGADPGFFKLATSNVKRAGVIINF